MLQTVTSRPQQTLKHRLFETRAHSLRLAAPLSPEDMVVQAMDDASPAKWHLAHVTWFFETFVLAKHLPGYAVFDESFNYCFNSYYETQGARHPRPRRGLLTRPSCARVMAYRTHVDQGLERLFEVGAPNAEVARLLEVGLNHEQQHQELLLTDILALFASNPLRPAYRSPAPATHGGSSHTGNWIAFDGGIRSVGCAGTRFAWDNEFPRHETLIHPFRLRNALVTNGEWLAFMDDGGYRDPLLWLADGWAALHREEWSAPLYWEKRDGVWFSMTLEGLLEIDPVRPVTHVSYFEADAFARWAGARLPTEHEWEVAAGDTSPDHDDDLCLRPAPARDGHGLQQVFGHTWQWTQSAYLPYPGYRPPSGALGEYNGKFMVSQHVLRGSSCATPRGHSRATYRNFFYPHQRWQFTGLRLASEI